jgi:hypothetical protein
LTGSILENTSAEALAAAAPGSMQPEDAEAAAASLVTMIERFRVHSFMPDTYSGQGFSVNGELVPWRFLVSWYQDQQSGVPLGTMELTARLGGDLQFVHIGNTGQIARLDSQWIDLLHPLLYNPETPPEHQPPVPSEPPAEDKPAPTS